MEETINQPTQQQESVQPTMQHQRPKYNQQVCMHLFFKEKSILLMLLKFNLQVSRVNAEVHNLSESQLAGRIAQALDSSQRQHAQPHQLRSTERPKFVRFKNL